MPVTTPEIALGTLIISAGVLTMMKTLNGTRRRAAHRHDRYRAEAIEIRNTLQAGDFTPPKFFYLVRSMNAYAFEELVMIELAARGVRAHKPTTYSGDGGIDGLFFIDGLPVLVQAKKYRGPVKRGHLEEFLQLARRHRARAMFVHTGKTSGPLLSWTKEQGDFTLISGQSLITFLTGGPLRLVWGPK